MGSDQDISISVSVSLEIFKLISVWKAISMNIFGAVGYHWPATAWYTISLDHDEWRPAAHARLSGTCMPHA